MTTLDDDAWDDLLSFIEERRVIPIVGPELLLVSTDRGPRLMLDWVAEKKKSPALLREAIALINNLIPALRATHDVKQSQARIQQALHGAAAANTPPTAQRPVTARNTSPGAYRAANARSAPSAMGRAVATRTSPAMDPTATAYNSPSVMDRAATACNVPSAIGRATATANAASSTVRRLTAAHNTPCAMVRIGATTGSSAPAERGAG